MTGKVMQWIGGAVFLVCVLCLMAAGVRHAQSLYAGCATLVVNLWTDPVWSFMGVITGGVVWYIGWLVRVTIKALKIGGENPPPPPDRPDPPPPPPPVRRTPPGGVDMANYESVKEFTL